MSKKLSIVEKEALELLKSNIREYLEEELKERHGLSANPNLDAIQEVVFNEFGRGKIHPKRQRPLLIQALKEVVAEL